MYLKSKHNINFKEKRMLNASKNDNIVFFLMCAPVIVYIFIFSYLPMGGMIIAFKDYQYNLGIFQSPWVGLKNFEFFFQSDAAWTVTRNTVFLNCLFIVFGRIFGVLFALLLFELTRNWAIKLFQSIFMLPYFISWVVVGFMTYSLLNPQLGLFNSVLSSLGINPVQWYSEPGVWPVILTVASVWKGVGIGCMMFYASLMSIDKGLYEAAEIDGATRLQQTYYISIPFLIPTVITLTILSIGELFRGDFGMFFNLTRDVGALYKTTDIIDTYVFRSLRVIGDVGMSSAVGLYQSVVGFILIISANAIVRKVQSDSALF